MQGKEIITDILLTQLEKATFNLDRTKIRARCIFCGDSKSKSNDLSLNIKIPDEEDPRWLYICFRSECGVKGAITPEFLRMLNVNSFEGNVYLNKVNKSTKKSKGFREKNRRNIANFLSPDDKLSRAKLKYINDRIGADLSLKDLVNLKLHTNMESLYMYNDIKFPKKREFYYKQISLNCISFISMYNDYLICRKVTKNEKLKRYTVIDIFENETSAEEKHKFYSIPTKIDVMSTDPIVINMAEGGFDILSVYLNVDIDSEYENHLHISVSGSSYERTLVHLIRQYGLVDIIVNIFSDDNIDIQDYKYLYKKVKKYCNTIEMKVHYNNLNDDFGVPKDKIDIRTEYI